MNTVSQLPLVIVTPVYEDEIAANRLFKELKIALGTDVFIVVVDDGSILQPVNVSSLQIANIDGVIIKLKRNVGHQRAIAIGLNYVAKMLPNAERVVIMDSDGEDLPSTIPDLLCVLSQSDVDIVVAQRKNRVETFRFRIFYLVYKLLFQFLSGRSISFGNFMALKPIAVKRMAFMQEIWIHVPGCALYSKLRIASCPLDRGPRYAGQSKMNFVGLALHGFRGLMVYAEDVLVRVGIACAFVAAVSIIGGAVAIGLKLFNYATPGWFSVAFGILLLVFLQTGALTLMSLMLTGVMRGGLVISAVYDDFIETIIYVRDLTEA
jgi:glycosyltransferase involved in cell wall biosynthesis